MGRLGLQLVGTVAVLLGQIALGADGPPSPRVESSLRFTSQPAAGQNSGPTTDALEQSLRNYRIRMRPDGLVTGRIQLVDPETGQFAPLSDVRVSFVQNGREKASTQLQEDGLFELKGLEPGIYSLVGAGSSGYIAYGLQLLPAPPGENPPDRRRPGDPIPVRPVFFQEVTESLEIDSLAVPPRDYNAVAQLMRVFIPATVLGARPGELPEIAQPDESETQEDRDLTEPQGEEPPSTVLRRHSVQLRPDGSLTGRTRRIHPQTGKPTRMRRLNVSLIRDNSIVAQAPVTPTGTFTFESVTPGLYSFVAAGVEGFAAFSVQVVSPDEKTTQVPRELIVPVAFAQENVLNLDGTLVGPEDVSFANDRLTQFMPEKRTNLAEVMQALETGGDETTDTPSTAGSRGRGFASTGNFQSSTGLGDGGVGGGYPGGGGGGGGRAAGADVPEIDPSSVLGPLALLFGALMLLTSRRAR